MKKLIIIICISLIGFVHANAQKQVCGNDTVVLILNNFHYGEIQWEESVDSINWVAIPNACDTFYKFFPEKSKYYRAVGITADCPPSYSEVTYVAKPIKANAGLDRIICGDSLSLTANQFKKANGNWSILSGSGGNLSDNFKPNTAFIGQKNTSYRLIWMLSNVCGSSTDTVNIEFITNTYRNNYVIVDSTDIILSDSNQMANGNYTIIFSSPVPTITDSSIMIGVLGEGFLRKVSSFNSKHDTFFIQTEAGALSDFTISGAFNFAPNLYPTSILTRSGKLLNNSRGRYPTRKDILAGKYKDGELAYEGTVIDYIEKGVQINNPGLTRGDLKMVLELKDVPIYSDTVKNIEITANGSITILPNFVAQLEIKDLKLNKFELGLDNAEIEYKIGASLSISKEFDLVDFKKTLFRFDKIMVFMAGPVPVVVTAGVKLNVVFNITAEGKIEVTAEVVKTDNVSAGIKYNTSTQKFDSYFSYDDEVEFNVDGSITASINQEFSISTEVAVKLYGVVGTYLDIKILKETFSLCTNIPDWSSECNVSTDITVGARADIDLRFFTLTIFDYNKTFSFGWYKNQFPYSLNVLSGNHQLGIPDQYLPDPVVLQVKSNWGVNIPFVPVWFTTNDGSLSKDMVFTDLNGKAQVDWKIANKAGPQVLNASVYDCDGEEISNTPLTIYGSDTSYNCLRSSLSLKIIYDSIHIYPVGAGGLAPYFYSRDGKTYVANIMDDLINDSNYRYYVRDSRGCIRSKSLHYLKNPCQYSTLKLNIYADNGFIDASGSGGKKPYKFALNNKTSFQSKSNFTNLTPALYKVYLKDYTGCMDSLNVNLLKKLSLPTLSTKQISSITPFTAICGGIISNDGGATITQSGICWSTSSDPTTANFKTIRNDGVGSFTDTLTSLKFATTYYVRAYAINVVGTAYGNKVTFKTLPVYAAVATKAITGITPYQAISGGTVIFDGGSHITQSGICWNTSPNPTVTNFKTIDTTSTGSYTDTMKSLSPATKYFVRAYAVNGVGTSYGNEDSFITQTILPSLTTRSISGITTKSAVSGGNIISNGGFPITQSGICWNTSPNPTVTNFKTIDTISTGSYTDTMKSLNPATKYYVRAYAKNGVGTAYGNEDSFVTLPEFATIVTTAMTKYTYYKAISGGNISSNGGSTITSCGICWSVFPNPTTSNNKTSHTQGSGSFTDTMSGLTPNINYFVRAYAVNGAGTSYGNQIYFKTAYTDIDGNIYDTVVIGTQIWMKSNLKTTRYRNGKPLPNISNGTTWVGLTTGARTFYNNDSATYSGTYGTMYNWFAAVDTNLICPSGWHIPTLTEWTTLENYLINNAYNYDGTTSGNKIAKSMATATGWNSDVTTGSVGNTDYPSYRNRSNFSGLPGGFRGSGGGFGGAGFLGFWWSSTSYDAVSAWGLSLRSTNIDTVKSPSSKYCGFSVRCIRD